jgi:hypothetical protein
LEVGGVLVELGRPPGGRLDAPIAGTNGLMRWQMPIGDAPELYFRVGAQSP